MYFTYIQINSDHTFKAQNVAFRGNPRKRTGMHRNPGFRLPKDQLFHNDLHLFPRNLLFQLNISKILENNALGKPLRFLVKNLVPKVLGAFSS